MKSVILGDRVDNKRMAESLILASPQLKDTLVGMLLRTAEWLKEIRKPDSERPIELQDVNLPEPEEEQDYDDLDIGFYGYEDIADGSLENLRPDQEEQQLGEYRPEELLFLMKRRKKDRMGVDPTYETFGAEGSPERMVIDLIEGRSRNFEFRPKEDIPVGF